MSAAAAPSSSSIPPRVQVVVRSRPRRSREEYADETTFQYDQLRGSNNRSRGGHDDTNNTGSIKYVNDSKVQMQLDRHVGTRSFTFDKVLDGQTSQEQIFSTLIEPLLESTLNPNAVEKSATILAYGQTGSGKSFTMGLLEKTGGGQDEISPTSGIIPRSLAYVFKHLHPTNAAVQLSFVEMYLDKVQDLLSSDNSKKKVSLALRQSKSSKGFHADGLSIHTVNSFKNAQLLMRRAMKNRIIASTRKNLNSTRSHTLLRVTIDDKSFLFVDLAGSERIHPSSLDKVRQAEATHINKSLSALGTVIATLCNKSNARGGGRRHIPYRNSKLTKLLEGTLRGTGRVCLIATVDESSKSETLSTLTFASRCRNLVPDPVMKDNRVKASLKDAYTKLKMDYQTVLVTMAKREEEIHSMYTEKIMEIESESQAAAASNTFSNNNNASGNGPPDSFSDATVASYYALCDISNRILNDTTTTTTHPAIEEFEHENWLVSYITRLYAVVMDKMDATLLREEEGVLRETLSIMNSDSSESDDSGDYNQLEDALKKSSQRPNVSISLF